MDAELRAKIESLRHYKMSPYELFEQRVSFVYSGQNDGPHAQSKDAIRQQLFENHGCPHADYDALRAAAIDALAGWRYIRATHGDLYGVGWDRVENALTAALAAQPTKG